MRKCENRRGTALMEFTLCTIPLLFVILSVLWMCIGMWQYHTVAEAVNVTARQASVHGAGCAGQTCATTVDSVARFLAGRAIGIPASQLSVTLTSSAATVTCNPVSNCYGNSASWPSLSGNTTSTDLTISASFTFSSPISMWQSAQTKTSFSSVTLGANSRQQVVF